MADDDGWRSLERPGLTEPESRSYAATYDPNREAQWTNLPEMRDQVAVDQYLARYAQEARDLREEEQNARVHVWPDVGKFIIPAENTFAGHEQLVESGELKWNPSAYPYSLAIMVERAQRPDLFDPTHKDYAKNEMARTNLLVMWNDIKGIYMDDSEFNPGDEKFIPQLLSIAETLGDGLRYEKTPVGRLFMPHLNTEHLNIEGEGAAHAYDFLMSHQRDPQILAGLRRDMRRLTGLPLREWGLPPKDQTPFSQAALDQPRPNDVLAMSLAQACEHCHQQQLSKKQETPEKPAEKPLETAAESAPEKNTQAADFAWRGKIDQERSKPAEAAHVRIA